MQKVILIGNGLDLNIGLKTSYKDFYESKIRNNDNINLGPLIKYLNECYSAKSWIDLEKEMMRFISLNTNNNGEYTRDVVRTLNDYNVIHICPKSLK
jgi:hypothetical protein